MAHPKRTLSSSFPRGSSLLYVVTILAVLSVVGLALVKRSNTEMDAAGAKRNYDKTVACADAARQMLLSQFRIYGVSGTLAPNTPGSPVDVSLNAPADDKTMYSGHYDSVTVTSVTPADGSATTGQLGMNGMAGKQVRQASGGLYRMTVVCSTGTGSSATRQSEVEFLVKFGLL